MKINRRYAQRGTWPRFSYEERAMKCNEKVQNDVKLYSRKIRTPHSYPRSGVPNQQKTGRNACTTWHSFGTSVRRTRHLTRILNLNLPIKPSLSSVVSRTPKASVKGAIPFLPSFHSALDLTYSAQNAPSENDGKRRSRITNVRNDSKLWTRASQHRQKLASSLTTNRKWRLATFTQSTSPSFTLLFSPLSNNSPHMRYVIRRGISLVLKDYQLRLGLSKLLNCLLRLVRH